MLKVKKQASKVLMMGIGYMFGEWKTVLHLGKPYGLLKGYITFDTQISKEPKEMCSWSLGMGTSTYSTCLHLLSEHKTTVVSGSVSSVQPGIIIEVALCARIGIFN